MNCVYHGSKEVNLNIIERSVSTHKKDWVYGTPNKALALLFINNGNGDLSYMINWNGDINSPILLVERKPDTFKNIYNLSGSIYTLCADNFKSGLTSWGMEQVSNRDENIVSEEYIVNIWNEINKMAKEAKIKIYFYPDRPDFIPLDNSDLIEKIIRVNDKTFTDTFLALYPELADRYYQALEESTINNGRH